MTQIVKVNKPTVMGLKPEQIEKEPFMLRKRSKEETDDYDAGFERGAGARGFDHTKNDAWQRGWIESQE